MRRHGARSSRPQRGGPSLRVAGLSIAALLLVLIVATATHRLPGWIWAWHAAASLLCFALYAADKSAAQAGRWRTPESTLLTFGLIGGWPGAIVGTGQTQLLVAVTDASRTVGTAIVGVR